MKKSIDLKTISKIIIFIPFINNFCIFLWWIRCAKTSNSSHHLFKGFIRIVIYGFTLFVVAGILDKYSTSIEWLETISLLIMNYILPLAIGWGLKDLPDNNI